MGGFLGVFLVDGAIVQLKTRVRKIQKILTLAVGPVIGMIIRVIKYNVFINLKCVIWPRIFGVMDLFSSDIFATL
jgi:hypothetical protein